MPPRVGPHFPLRPRSADEEALLRAVLYAPNDDAPRLVYADWLDEHGEPERATFIRVQCELARTDEADDRFLELQEQEARLWKKYRAKWTKPLPLSARQFRRGFPVAGYHLFHPHLVDRFDPADWEVTPGLSVGFYGDLSGIARVAAWTGLARVTDLQLRGYRLTGTGLGRLLASPHLTNLTGFEATLGRFGEADVRALVRSPVWPRLTRLSYWHRNSIGFDEPGIAGRPLERLAAADPAPLAELSIRDVSVRAEDARVLTASPLLAGVRELSLGMTWIGSAGVTALAKSPHLAGVRGLGLSYVGRVSGRAAEALAHSPHLSRLCRLQLGLLSDPDAALAFVTSPHMARLRGLHIVCSSRGKLSRSVAGKVRRRFGKGCLIRSVV